MFTNYLCGIGKPVGHPYYKDFRPDYFPSYSVRQQD